MNLSPRFAGYSVFALLGGLAVFQGCSERESPSDAGVCTSGDTRVCAGPGACEGAQICNDGAWSSCDCGEGEGGADGGAGSAAGGDVASGGRTTHSGGTASSLGGADGNPASGGTSSSGGGTPSSGGSQPGGTGGTNGGDFDNTPCFETCEVGVCSAQGVCRECDQDSDCETGSLCLANACVGAPTCENSLGCAVNEVCDPNQKACVRCSMDADCTDGEACRDHECFAPCESDTDCTPEGLLCGTDDHCAVCAQDADCPDDGSCVNGACLADVCAVDEVSCGVDVAFSCGADGYQHVAEECDYGCNEESRVCETNPPPCAEGTSAATTIPSSIVWLWWNGFAEVPIYTDATVGADGFGLGVNGTNMHLALTPFAPESRACQDASAFTGVQFDLSSTTNLSTVRFEVVTSANDPSGHCVEDCYDHPGVEVPVATGIQVPFSSLVTGSRGGAFDATQVIGFNWRPLNSSEQIRVSQVSFY